VKHLVAEREIEAVLDIGAYRGNYGLMLREVGFGGRIVSFEPSPSAARILRSRLDPVGRRTKSLSATQTVEPS
jgi:FkbM family methyltransferase